MSELPIEKILLAGVACIERMGVEYAVMGGFAARAWGLPRPKHDADIAVAADADGLQRLPAGLEQAGFDVPPEHKTGFVEAIGGLAKVKVTCFEGGHVWSTDLFPVRGAFLNSALARGVFIAGRRVRVM